MLRSTDPSSSNRNLAATASRARSRRDEHLYAPSLELDAEGNILSVTAPARRLLEYRPEQEVESCFFSHVHGRNLYQVMRDVADMVCYGKTRASWLFRLRTGQGRWRWYRATAANRLDATKPAISITLRDLYDWT